MRNYLNSSRLAIFAVFLMGIAAQAPQTVHAQTSSEQVLINMNPMSLDDAIKLGLERNFGIQLAKNQAEIARLNRNFGAAGMTPDLDVTAGISGGREDLVETVDGAEGPSVRTTNQVSNIDAALNWTIFDGFRMFTTYERLGELERLGEVRARVEIESSVADIINSYYTIVRINRRLAVLENTVEISEERYRIADTKRQLGSGSEYDLLLARTDLNSDRAVVIQEKVLLNDARLRLLQHLGLSPQTEFEIDPEIRFGETLLLDDVYAGITENNKILQASAIEQRIASLQRRELIQGRLPQIDVNAGYNINNRETRNASTRLQENDGYRYGITLRVPIFDGLNMNRQVQAAQIARRNADLAYEEQFLLLQNIAMAEYQNYVSTLEVIEIERENLALVNETIEIALERFYLGTITSLELRESQRSLINTETRLITAKYEAKVSETELLRLMGRL